MTKEVRITTIWKHDDIVEVPDDFDPETGDTHEWMDQVDSVGAYLADWYWHHER